MVIEVQEEQSAGSPLGWASVMPGGVRLLRVARKVSIAIVGGGVLGVGVAMVVLPGPAILVIPLGLSILSTEFAWAERMLQRLTARLQQIKARAQGLRRYLPAR